MEKIKLEKIIGYEDEKRELTILLDTLLHPNKYKNPTLHKPKGLILKGEFEEYKNKVLEWFIRTTNKKYCELDSKIEDISVNRLMSFFTYAKGNDSILIIKENPDRLITKEEFNLFKEFLTKKNYADVFVIFVVTKDDLLQECLKELERYDSKVTIDYPVLPGLTTIVEYYLDQYDIETKIKPHEIAQLLLDTRDFSLEETLNKVLLISSYNQHEKITDEDFKEALMRNFRYNSKIVEKDKNLYYKKAAIHEAGHLLLKELQSSGSVIFSYIISGKNGFNGSTFYIDFNSGNFNIDDVEKRIMVALGGKAAVEITYNFEDLGTSEDLNWAFNFLKRVYTKCYIEGYKEKLNTEISGDDTIINEKISVKLNEILDKTKKYLNQNKAFLDAVADFIYENETIYQSDIMEIKSSLHI